MNYIELYRTIAAGEDLGRVSTWVVQLLTEILDGRRHILAVRHPLGFICLPIERDEVNGVCLHVWDGEPAWTSTTSQVHAHSWDLFSYVLIGEVHNEVIEVADDEVSPASRVFEVRSRGDVDELRATPRLVRHTRRATHVKPSGLWYRLPAGEFHTTVVPAGRTTATIALGSTRRGGRDLSLGPIDGRSHSIRRQRCDRQETMQVAQTVADRAVACGVPHDGGRRP